MKKNLVKLGSMVALAGLLFTACKKDNAGSPSGAQAQLSIGVKADNASTNLSTNNTANGLTTQATGSGSVNWTAGVANISGFKLEAKRNGMEIEIRSKNLASVDLFAPIPPSVTNLIDTGTYREIEFRVMLTKTSGTDLPLKLKGNFTTAGGAVVPIELNFNDDAIIKAEAKNVTVDNTTDLSTVVTIHLNKLLDHVSATALDGADRTSGTIVISNSSNTRIYAIIKDNIGNCGEAGGFDRHGRH